MQAQIKTSCRTCSGRILCPARIVKAIPSTVRRFKENDEREVEAQQPKPVIDEDPLYLVKQGLPKSLHEIQRAVQQAGQRPMDRAPKVGPLQPAFTRGREILVGRFAMVGFFMACFWETNIPSHPGILAQLKYFTGLDTPTIATAFLVLITVNFIGALAPWSPTYDQRNLIDVAQRPVGPPATFVNPLNIKKFFGISGWGFTKKNELFHGRLAMLGFLAALVNEVRIGGGPLAQVAYWLGTPADDAYYDLLSRGFGIFVIVAILSAYLAGKPGWQADQENDIY